jgi:hypothetical protein
MRYPFTLERVAGDGEAALGSLLRRTLRRLLRRREPLRIEREAAHCRAESLFEVNFRNPWTR